MLAYITIRLFLNSYRPSKCPLLGKKKLFQMEDVKLTSAIQGTPINWKICYTKKFSSTWILKLYHSNQRESSFNKKMIRKKPFADEKAKGDQKRATAKGLQRPARPRSFPALRERGVLLLRVRPTAPRQTSKPLPLGHRESARWVAVAEREWEAHWSSCQRHHIL